MIVAYLSQTKSILYVIELNKNNYIFNINFILIKIRIGVHLGQTKK